MTLAKAFVTGTVIKAPEKRFTQNDMPIAGFSISVDNVDAPLRVIAFGQLADTVCATIAQGDSVAAEGRLQANTYKLPNGRDKKIFEINASSVEKISTTGKTMSAAADSKQAAPAAAAPAQKEENIVSFNQDEIAEDLIDEDEIPF